MKKLCLLLACLLVLSGCTASAPGDGSDVKPPTENDVTRIGTVTPISLDATFGDLMDELLAEADGNSCISPLSFKLALAMAYNGAEGDTAELLQEVFGMSPDEVNAWASAYLAAAKAYDGKADNDYSPSNPELRIANSYWLRQGMEDEISEGFINTLKSGYDAESGVFDGSPDPINEWVKAATNGKIEDILADIDPVTLSYLVNALYFNAQWGSDFDKNLTAPGEFTNSDGSKVQTAMLHGAASSYINTPEFEGMTKTLNGGFTFTAVMPKAEVPVTLAALAEAQNSVDNSYTAVTLTLPKFDFDTSVDFGKGSYPEFNALFAPHGMDGALADNAEASDLSISEVVHKTTFTLTEAGIEASAATVVGMSSSAAQIEPKVVEIVFDKPFYFTLTDKDGEILFVGRVLTLK
jgi:serpin B